MRKLLIASLFTLVAVTPALAVDGGAAARMKALREKNQQNVQKIRNEKKQELVKKIDARLCEIRKNRTTGMTNQIVMLNKLLAKLEAREGVDATKVSAAKTAIAEAKTAVEALSSEDCGVQITTATDSAVGKDVRASIKNVSEQWKAAQEKIVLAKKALRELVGANKTNEKSQ